MNPCTSSFRFRVRSGPNCFVSGSNPGAKQKPEMELETILVHEAKKFCKVYGTNSSVTDIEEK